MLEFFDKRYSSIEGRGPIKSIIRFSIRLFVNILLPFYFRLPVRQVNKVEKRIERNVIVSLTTFPGRISRLWLVIECMLRQTYIPDKIILYLSREQFPNLTADLPKKLRSYASKNQLEIVFVEGDIRSHKKYYYSFRSFPNDLVVLVDDDILYVDNMIESLLCLHKKFPKSICCHRAYKVIRNEKGEITSYRDWEMLAGYKGPARDTFHTSGGGTLYCPSLLPIELFDQHVFERICLHADDIWLNFHAQRSNVFSVKSDYYSPYLPIMQKRGVNLKTLNVAAGGNDRQLKALLDYYNVTEHSVF